MGEADRQLAGVAYILTWITGLVILALAQRDQRYARWHAIQAIGLGAVAFAGSLVLTLLLGALGYGWSWGGPGIGLIWWGGGLFDSLWSLMVLILVVVMAVQAFKGETIRLPLISRYADAIA